MACVFFKAWTIVSVLMVLSSSVAMAETQVATEKVAEWQGPESKAECEKWAKTDGTKTCVGHKNVCVKEAKVFGGKTCIGWATKCAKWVETPSVKTCAGHKVVWRKHKRYLVATSDMDISNLPQQTKEIADSCLAAAAATFAVGGATVDTLASVFADGFPVAESMFKSCIRTTETLGNVVEDSFTLEMKNVDEW